MPFDNTKPELFTKPDLSVPSLAGLSYVLRNLSEFLPNHHYEHERYAHHRPCGTVGCAIGVCQIIWPAVFSPVDLTPRIGYFSNLAYLRIFCTGAYGVSDKEVTPSMVADRIDEWVAKYGETRA